MKILHKRRESGIFALINAHFLPNNLAAFFQSPLMFFFMSHDIFRIIAMGTFFLGLPTIIGTFVLAYKNLKIREKRMESDSLREAKELELAERTLYLREKETELEIQKLELEIRLLERKQLDS